MECPHLIKDGVNLDVITKVLSNFTSESIQCSSCDAKESIWICVTCGMLNCGRYVKAHGLAHYENMGKLGHSVCMDCHELSVFCYACDDFIINDTPDSKLDSLRTVLVQIQQKQPAIVSSTINNSSNNSSEILMEVTKADTESSGTKDSGSNAGSSTGSGSGRRSSLRPRSRRRSQSMDSINGGVENQPAIKKSRKSSDGTNGNGNNKRNSFKSSTGPNNNSSSAIRKKEALKNLVGLRNLGNTCFMSAVLQSLGNINEFCHVLKQLPSFDDERLSSSSSGSSSSSTSSTSTNSKSKSGNPTTGIQSIAKSKESRNKNGVAPHPAEGPIMTEELRKVLLALSQDGQSAKHKVISPEALFHVIWKVVPRFRGYQQQDAHEFLRYMLDRLHTELLCLLPGDLNFLQQQNLSPYSRRRLSSTAKAKASTQSLVTSIFGGTLQSEVTCLSCKTSSKKHDPFLDLSIDIPSSFLQFRKSKDFDGERPQCTLYDCLQKFVDVEELAESERFYCNACKCKQKSTKKFWIRRLPNVLCLHIKRFRWSPYSRTKIDTHVGFPLSGLDMSQYLLSNLHETRCSNSGSSLYDLAAVIVHHGSGAGSGHYTAFGTKNSQWYHFNDSTVSVADPEVVKQSKAYILFYIQREFKLPPMT